MLADFVSVLMNEIHPGIMYICLEKKMEKALNFVLSKLWEPWMSHGCQSKFSLKIWISQLHMYLIKNMYSIYSILQPNNFCEI